MLANLLYASSRLLAPGLVQQQQQRAGAPNSREFSGRGHRGCAAAVPNADTDRAEPLEGDSAAWSASAAVWDAVAGGIGGRDAAFQRNSAGRHHAAATDDSKVLRAPGTTASTAERQRSRIASANGDHPQAVQEISAPPRSRHRSKPLPRRQQLKLPPVAASATAAPAAAADSTVPAVAAQARNLAAMAAAPSDCDGRANLSPLPPPPPQQQQPSGPTTPLLQDFLSCRGRLVKSVYREPGLHELQLQQELSSEQPALAQLPPPQLPQHASRAALPDAQQQRKGRRQQRKQERGARGGAIACSEQAEAAAVRRARRARLAAARAAARRADEEATAAAAALAGVEPGAVDALTASLLGGRKGGGAWGRQHVPKPHALMRLQNAYEVSMPDPLSWLLQRAIPQLDRDAEVQLTRLMRIGQQIAATAEQLQRQLGRPPSTAELAAAANRELATLRQLGPTGGAAAAAALARFDPQPAGEPALGQPALLQTALPDGSANNSSSSSSSSSSGGLPTLLGTSAAATARDFGAAAAGVQPRASPAGDAARQLAESVRDGRRARRILLDSQLRLVVRIASRYQYSANVALEELVQVGLQGLETGLDKFEPRRGGRLTTAVYWYVHTAVARGHAVMKDVVAVPYTTTYQLAVLYRASGTFRRQHRRGPTVAEMAEQLGWSLATVQRLFETQATSEVSMEAPVQGLLPVSRRNSGDGDAVDFVADAAAVASADGEDAALALVQDAELRRATIAALRRALKPHQADIVEQLYGLNGGDPQLQKDVAAQRNLTRARIFQIKELALDKLRKDEEFVGAASEMLGVVAPANTK